MKTWKIPVKWEMVDEILVTAESYEQALEQAKQTDISNFRDDQYVCESFDVNEDVIAEHADPANELVERSFRFDGLLFKPVRPITSESFQEILDNTSLVFAHDVVWYERFSETAKKYGIEGYYAYEICSTTPSGMKRIGTSMIQAIVSPVGLLRLLGTFLHEENDENSVISEQDVLKLIFKEVRNYCKGDVFMPRQTISYFDLISEFGALVYGGILKQCGFLDDNLNPLREAKESPILQKIMQTVARIREEYAKDDGTITEFDDNLFGEQVLEILLINLHPDYFETN